MGRDTGGSNGIARARARGAGLRPCFVVIDANPDHALLLREILEASHPDASVITDPRDAPSDGADALLVGTNTDPAAVLTILPPLRTASSLIVLVDGPSDRWAPADRARLAAGLVVDKRDIAGLESALGAIKIADRSAHEGNAPQAPEVEVASGKGPVSMPPPRPAPRVAPVATSAADAAPRNAAADAESEAAVLARELLVAGILAGEIREILAYLEPLSRLFTLRAPKDEAIARYTQSLQAEVRRAQSVAARIESMASAGGPLSPPRGIDLGRFLALRVAAWRAWLPSGVTITLSGERGLPLVDAWTEVLGPAIDDLLALLAAESGGAAAVSVRFSVLRSVDRGTSDEVRRGGPHVRVRFEARERAAHVVSSAPEADRALERGRLALHAHGGVLSIERQDGTVSAISLEIPESSGKREVSAPAVADAPRGAILVIDDDAEIRDLASEMLTLKRYAVTSVPGGEEALRLFRAGCRYGLVILDMQMPGMDGRSVFHELKKIDPDLRALLMSGSATGSDLRRMLAEGLLGFLPKPFSLRQLLESVESALSA